MSLVPLSEGLPVDNSFDDLVSQRNPFATQNAKYLIELLNCSQCCNVLDTGQCYLFLDQQGDLAGVVSFENLDLASCSARVEFYVSAKATSCAAFKLVFEAVELAFSDLRLGNLYCELPKAGLRIIGLLKKIGFCEEGHRAERCAIKKQTIDLVRFGLHKRDWTLVGESAQTQLFQLDRQMGSGSGDFDIVILSDEASWINEYSIDLQIDWEAKGYTVRVLHSIEALQNLYLEPQYDTGEGKKIRLCFCLSFGQIVGGELRKLFDHTLVVHESDLPLGKGWSPLSWQILEGKNRIPVTLFEAADDVDGGLIYAQDLIVFQGYELVEELRISQAEKTLSLCRWFVENFPESAKNARVNAGVESFYRRRFPQDSRLEVDQTIEQQFELFRIVDNFSYPAFFEFRGHRYRLFIERVE